VLGAYRKAQHHLARVVDAVEGDLARERWGMAGFVSVAARIWLAASLADTGDFEEALARAREGVTLGEGPEHPWSLSGAYMTVGFVHLSRGEPEEAAPVLEPRHRLLAGDGHHGLAADAAVRARGWPTYGAGTCWRAS